MEKYNFTMQTERKELITRFNSLLYEIKLQLYELEHRWANLPSEVKESDQTKEIAKDLLEENGFQRDDWSDFVIKKCEQASEQIQD